jgi:transposase-like protein
VTDKATRRRFTAAYKRRIVREADKCTKPGELGVLLRREGVYSSSLSVWRRQLAAGDLAGTGARRGPKAQTKDPRDKRIAELERETRRLERKLEQAETVIGIQKKVASLLGIPLRSPDDEENS